MKNTYWNNNGRYQQKLDEISGIIPSFEYTDNQYLNLFISTSKIYYDVYNNGGGNIDDCYIDDFYERIYPFIDSNLDELKCNKEYLEHFMDKVVDLLKDKDLIYTKYVVYQNYEKKQLSRIPLNGFSEISSGVKEYLDEWIKIRTSKGWDFSFIN